MNNLGLGIPVPDYVDENVSDKVVKIIQSYAGVLQEFLLLQYAGCLLYCQTCFSEKNIYS